MLNRRWHESSTILCKLPEIPALFWRAPTLSSDTSTDRSIPASTLAYSPSVQICVLKKYNLSEADSLPTLEKDVGRLGRTISPPSNRRGGVSGY